MIQIRPEDTIRIELYRKLRKKAVQQGKDKIVEYLTIRIDYIILQ